MAVEAQERVRDAVQEARERRDAGRVEAERIARARAGAEGVERALRERRQADFAALEQQARDAFAVTADAVSRLESVQRAATAMLTDFERANAGRRDVAEAKLEVLLGRVAGELQVRTATFVARLASPLGVVTVDDALGLAELVDRAVELDRVAAVLRAVVADGTFAPIDTAEFERRRAAAKPHRTAIERELMQARQAAAVVGAALQALGRGEPADASEAAAAALDAADRGAAALAAMSDALNPQINEGAGYG